MLKVKDFFGCGLLFNPCPEDTEVVDVRFSNLSMLDGGWDEKYVLVTGWIKRNDILQDCQIFSGMIPANTILVVRETGIC